MHRVSVRLTAAEVPGVGVDNGSALRYDFGVKTAAGLFWLPDTPEKKIAGRFMLTEDGSPQVELFDHITPSMKVVSHDPESGTWAEEPADDPPSFTVLGFLDKAPRAVSLFRCFTPTRSELSFVRTPLRKQTVRGTYALRGDAHVDTEEETFESVSVRVAGIDAWAALPGFDTKHEEGIDFSVKLHEIEDPKLQIDDKLSIEISTEVYQTGEFFREGRIRRTAWLTVRGFSLKQEALSAEYVGPLATYLEFAFAESTPITALRYRSGDFWFDVWHSGIENARDDDQANRWEVLLNRGSADLPIVINFLKTYERTAPAAPALADMLEGGKRASLETLVLELTTLVEGVHRTLHPDDTRMSNEDAERLKGVVRAALSGEDQRVQDIINGGLVHLSQPSYKMRLERLWEMAFPVIPAALGDKRRWVREVNKARNSFAHRDTGFLDDVQINTFIALVESLRWLLLVTLLLDAGVSREVLAERMAQHQRYIFSIETMKKYLPTVFGELQQS